MITLWTKGYGYLQQCDNQMLNAGSASQFGEFIFVSLSSRDILLSIGSDRVRLWDNGPPEVLTQ